ncbi:MAG: hypothetical protein Q8916_03180 [Bacteroidota bacterium]|nr:hypothetical protein [Bacteroidota bacterium]
MENEAEIKNDVPKGGSRSRIRKILYSAAGVIILAAIVISILLTTYPNTVIHFIVEPKLKQLVVDRLGRRYALQMKSITLTPGKDSLILVGVRIVDNGMTDEGSTDTSSQNFGVATPLDRLTTDTVMIAGLDYWKLIFQQGLFAGTITIRSPKIYLRPGTLPKFAGDATLLPSFLPAVSSKIIKIENAEVYLTESVPQTASPAGAGKSSLPANSGGVLVKKASLEFRDFYLDESRFKQTTPTFFCKSATFHAEDLSHTDSLGSTDIHVSSVEGDLIDSSMNVFFVESSTPIQEIRRTVINHIEFIGLDWYSALAGRGLHGRLVTITSPKIYFQDVVQLSKLPARHISASDLIPLPTLLPDVSMDNVDISNAEISALFPDSHDNTSLKRISMTLKKFKIDHATPFTAVSKFFSDSARYTMAEGNVLHTALGTIVLGKIRGTERTLSASDISITPTLKSIKLIKLGSAEIGGLDIWKLLMREGLFGSTAVLNKPQVFLAAGVAPPITSIDSLLSSDPLAPIRSIHEYPLPLLLPAAKFEAVTVNSGSIHGIHVLDDPSNTSGPGDSLTNINISLKKFDLSRNSWIRDRGMLFSEVGTFSIGAMTQLTRGAVYSYREGGVRGDLRKRTLTIDSLIVHPLIPEDSFGAAFKYRTERIDLFAPRILIRGVDYKKFLLGFGLFADSLLVADWRMHVYGDRRRPEEPRTSSDKFPHELFRMIQIPVGMKAVVLREGEIRFRESWPDTTEPGTITLSHVNARLGAISNDLRIAGDTVSTPISGNLMVMNAGKVSFTGEYQFLNPHLHLDIHGTAGSMDASILNEYLALTEPFTLTGTIRSAQINIELRDNLMTGTLIPQYDSLHVKFFRWDRFPPGFVSFLANGLFMRSHNIPELDHPLHVGEISAILQPNVSLFWALWQPIRSAIGSVVRIPEWVW